MLVAALLTTTFAGCAPSIKALGPTLPEHLPRECQRLLTKVPDPGAKVGSDLGDIAAGYKGAFEKANHRIGTAKACDDHQADAVDRGAR